MQSNSVVLPAPFWPMSPRISPWRRSRSTSSTAWMPPKRLTMPRQESRTGASSAGGAGRCPSGAAAWPRAFGPWRMNTDRSRSGRSSRSAVGPVKRTSPFSMNTARCASVRATLTDCSTMHDRGAGGMDRAEHVEEVADDRRRQAERQLVDHQQAGLRHERLGQRQHLLLAAGEEAGRLGVALGQDREQLQHLGPGGFDAGRVLAERPGGEAEVLVDGDGGEDPLAARHERDAGPGHGFGVGAGDVAPVEGTPCRRSGSMSPETAFSSVDFPAPLVPRRATISPSSTSKSTPKRTCTGP